MTIPDPKDGNFIICADIDDLQQVGSIGPVNHHHLIRMGHPVGDLKSRVHVADGRRARALGVDRAARENYAGIATWPRTLCMF
jgi:hypothetical protein